MIKYQSDELILAHDLGTSGNKATIFSASGEKIDSRTVGYSTGYSNDNWAEQDPGDWWKAVCLSSRELLEKHNIDKIAAVAFSGQMMGCLCVDKNGIPLRNSIIYSDQRAGKQTASLVSVIDPAKVYRITGHKASPSYSIEKLMWIRDNEPEIYRNTYKMLNAKDYINYKLTGKFYTDTNDASGTNAFDISKMQWSSDILDASGIDPDKLPEAVSSVSVIGEVTAEASRATGIPAGTPVVAGAGDGGCATVGSGSVAEGITYNYLGSSSWISTTTKEPLFDEQQRTFTWVHPAPGFYQPCGTMQTAGSSYAWLKSNICREESAEAEKLDQNAYEIMNGKIADSVPGSNGVFFLPYLLGERSPWWNPQARGAWVGIGLETSRGDIIRSVLEGISFNLEIIFSIMNGMIPIDEIVVIGGGAKGNAWMKILSEILGVPVLIPRYLEEATSMGAAIIGGVGAGCLKSFSDAERFITIVDKIVPEKENIAAYEKLKPVFKLCYESLENVFPKLR